MNLTKKITFQIQTQNLFLAIVKGILSLMYIDLGKMKHTSNLSKSLENKSILNQKTTVNPNILELCNLKNIIAIFYLK